jgi:predicted AAA+ superfamily ATPase
MFSRTLKLEEYLRETSLLLLGPRQSGKTTLLQHSFKNALTFDLLEPELFRDLNKSPSLLKELIGNKNDRVVIVDEIQKLPELLDVVHSLIEKNKKLRFVLTGSSARKLKKVGQNLLGGRAYPLNLHPITSFEYLNNLKNSEKSLALDRLIQLGGLPSVLTAETPLNKLKAYVGIYLQEEIKAEGYARNLSDFSKFLDVAALTNAEQLDFAGVARDVQLAPRTVAAYYSILQDTLIGYLLESFKKTKTRKAVITPKFYYFDVGVSNLLTGRDKIAKGTPEYGKAMEHFVFTELIAYKDYRNQQFELFYWRSTSQFEVDFILQLKSKKLIGIEVKATNHVDQHDFKGFKAFEEDFKLSKKIIVCNEKRERLIGGEYQALPLLNFCEMLWSGKLFAED